MTPSTKAVLATVGIVIAVAIFVAGYIINAKLMMLVLLEVSLLILVVGAIKGIYNSFKRYYENRG